MDAQRLSRYLAARSSRELILMVVQDLQDHVPWDAVGAFGVTPRTGLQRTILAIDVAKDGTRFEEEISERDAEMSPLFRRTLESEGLLLKNQSEIHSIGFAPFGNRSRLSTSMINVPIRNSQGAGFAVLGLHRYSDVPFTEGDLEQVRRELRIIAPALEHHLACEQERREHAFVQRALRQIKAAAYERDYRTGSFTSLGHGLPELLGYPEEEISSALWKRAVQDTVLLHEPPGITFPQAIERALAGVTSGWRADMRLRTSSGEECWISDTAVTLYDTDGRARGSVGILQDVTAAKQSSRLRDLLAEISPKVAAVSTSREIARIVLDSLRRILYWDSAFLLVRTASETDYDMAYLVDTSAEGELAEFTDTAPIVMDPPMLERMKQPRLIDRVRYPERSIGKTRLRLGFTERTSKYLLYVPLYLSGARLIGVLSIQRYEAPPFTDADLEILQIVAAHCAEAVGRAHAEEQQARLKERVQIAEKLESLGALAGGMAHEFNNLLSSVLGNVGLMQLDYAEGTPARECATQVEAAAFRMRELTRQILAFAGRVEVRMDHEPAAAIIRELEELARLGLPKRVRLKWSLTDPQLHLRCDPSQIKQALLCLLRNAAEAVTDPEALIEVTFSHRVVLAAELSRMVPHPPRQPGAYHLITVSDKGVGVAPDALRRLAEPFYTTKFIGRGLGLAMVKGIAESHDGGFTVESTLGQGTRVTIFISDPAPAPASNLAGKRALLVDDDPVSIDALSRLLRRLEIRVVPTGIVAAALNLLEKSPGTWDLVLLNAGLVGGEAPALASRVRQLSATIPVIVVGARSNDSTWSAAAPFEEVAMPATSEVLEGTIRRALS